DKIYILNTNGTIDPNFNISGFYSNRTQKNLELTPDNKVLVFDLVLKRLLSNGTIDQGFSTNFSNRYRIEASKILANGKILIAGSFSTPSGEIENKVYRLLSNGRIDSTFSLSARANGAFRTMTTLANGKILLSGEFTSYNGVAVNNVVRLNADGTNDMSFSIAGTFNGAINSIAELTDGSLLVGGSFNEYNGNPVSGLLKFDANGTLVSNFNASLKIIIGDFTSIVNDILVMPNGKIVIGGWFNSVNGIRANNIAMINSNGSTDMEFNQFETLPPSIFKVVKDGNSGNWIVAGSFDTFGGHKTFGIARVLSNGAVDTTFKHETNHTSSFYSYESLGGLAVDGNGNIHFSAKGKPYNNLYYAEYLFKYSISLNPNGSVIENSFFATSANTLHAPWIN
ncbi:MAG: delta-60 repeat domain-containing protein, partial [Chitinophagaceae bacterium]